MSGHSKWSTIKRSKGIEDAKRGLTFTKLANVITIAAKLGNSGNIDDNPRLRMAVDEAKSVNMPKDNIQRAIDRGLGKLPGQTVEEAVYEGFGPSVDGGKAAFIIECVTDNKLRTLQVIKNIFDRAGGALAGQGSVSFMFDKVGEVKVMSKGGVKDEELLELIDSGARDVEDFEEDGVQKYLLYTSPLELNIVNSKINTMGYVIESSELILKPNTPMKITDTEAAKKVLDFVEKLEEQDDVQKVYSNFEL